MILKIGFLTRITMFILIPYGGQKLRLNALSDFTWFGGMVFYTGKFSKKQLFFKSKSTFKKQS